MSKNILVLTPTYPADDFPKETPPIVHYFTKEWVKLGHNVIVIHCPAKFPRLMTLCASLIEQQLSSIFGFRIKTMDIKPREYILDGVLVKRVPMKKVIPHSAYSDKEIVAATSTIVSFCKSKDFVPDIIVSHWANPGTILIQELKKVFNAKACFIEHSHGTELLNFCNKETALKIINSMDIIGFRSAYIKKSFCERYNYTGKNFMCYSGIPETSINSNSAKRKFEKINSFIYVGHMIKRKFPTALIPAISKVYKNEDFTVTYIGRGKEEKSIAKMALTYGIEKNINLCGRVDRSSIFDILAKHDVFVMISKNETFGLVYLEAMAAGCITIASKREGFDGIIQHGYNGFLCEAGNDKELEKLIKQIKEMPSEELIQISKNAIETAKDLTDKKVALRYINNIIN